MKKFIYLVLFCSLSVFLLVGCTNDAESGPIANKSDLENAFFESNRYQFAISEDKLLLMGYRYIGDRHSFDDILFDGEETKSDSVSVHMEFDNVKVKTKGSEYFITADGISFTMKKFMDHIITDELGNEYIRNKFK